MTASHILPRASGHSPLPNPKNWAFPVADRKNSLLDFLDFGTFDDENKLVFFEEKKSFWVGFGLWRHAGALLGPDADHEMESILSREWPEGTVLQFGTLNVPEQHELFESWLLQRSSPTFPSLLERNKATMARFTDRESNLTGFHGQATDGRLSRHLLFARIPVDVRYRAPEHRQSLVPWVDELRRNCFGHKEHLTRKDYQWLMEHLVFPQQGLTSARFANSGKEPATVLRIPSQKASSDVLVTPMTIDNLPQSFSKNRMDLLLGEGLDASLNFPPYWAYTTVEILDREGAHRQLEHKRSMLRTAPTLTPRQKSHNEHRASDVEDFMNQMRYGYMPVRAYTGINLYTAASNREAACETVQRRFRQFGFRISPEKYLTAPAFIASLPFQYRADQNKPGKGLQRASLMLSQHATSFIPSLTSEPTTRDGGFLVTTRRNELSTIDPWQYGGGTYNFLILGDVEQDKLTLSSEIIYDALSREGSALVLDFFGEFESLQKLTDTPSIKLSRKAPFSVDPLCGFNLRASPLMHLGPERRAATVLVNLAFNGCSPEGNKVEQAEQLVAETIAKEAYSTPHLEIRDVFHALEKQDNALARELASGLRPFAIGEHAEWFTGPCPLDIEAPLTVLDFSELFSSDRQKSTFSNSLVNAITQCTLLRREFSLELDLAQKRRHPKLTLLTDAAAFKSYRREESLTSLLRQRRLRSSIGVICRGEPDQFFASTTGRAVAQYTNMRLFLSTSPRKIDALTRDSLVDENIAKRWRSVGTDSAILEFFMDRVLPNSHQEVYRVVRQEESRQPIVSRSPALPPPLTSFFRSWKAPILSPAVVAELPAMLRPESSPRPLEVKPK
jgi:conjugal transfer ATP-binding protein TraC